MTKKAVVVEFWEQVTGDKTTTFKCSFKLTNVPWTFFFGKVKQNMLSKDQIIELEKQEGKKLLEQLSKSDMKPQKSIL